ncbi:probable polygalacturonase At3g15720 [Salvia splendens]|uniref:probable polygalacturonase At3g15720 n=1 Tax=Salvia splendens TaxID=180675 RepID=UPI001C26DB2D|nr:probable polygalacturonase At3g15720 [Salvia splendens]
MDSKSETEVEDVCGDDASNSDTTGVSISSIALLGEKHGVEEDRAVSPADYQVSASKEIYWSCSSDVNSILSTAPLSAATLLSDVDRDFKCLLQGHTQDEWDICLAFARAWEETCASLSPPAMIVPSGRSFLIQPLRFTGPCESNPLTILIDGNLVAPIDPSTWKCDANDCYQWLYFHKVEGLTLLGQGIIDGRGQQWWLNKGQTRPSLMKISNSANVRVGGGLRFVNSPLMHLILHGLHSVYVSDITVQSPEDSPNTDGIHIQASTNVHIDSCIIGTGDDCIAILNGSSNVRITNIKCGPGHGISIGSLGKNGQEDRVEDIRVSDVVFLGATNGARIKTWQGGRGYARDIHFERFWFQDTINPIIIDQFYCNQLSQCKTSNSAVEISNVSFKMMVGSSGRENVVVLKCSEAVPCRGILVEDMHIVATGNTPATYDCANVIGRAQGHLVPEIVF